MMALFGLAAAAVLRRRKLAQLFAGKRTA
ncbi:hypothetical protein Q9K01_11060 [Qipengyuania sp. DY56-A-20]|uniref:Uncharacterized protein n=1 Tax=Qipengyuania benthica TaxID=3067651 RepID=A0ABT9HA20_9SPHN|nr:hypothetical protein [Qipengyuania sp. DY56-A-20]MDP4540166.1 hypothetical protein [Qipengyuania sp. DY56-A-20]